MSTLVLHHDDCLRHKPGRNHPESPQRVRSVLAALQQVAGVQCLPAPLASQQQIERVHPADYWRAVVSAEPAEGRVELDPDTYISAGSINAALRAAGGLCFAVDQVLSGQAQNAFCATRPPGHHAEASRSMGFCLLNNVAIAARHALAQANIERVAIVDFDVHHGNGTQAIFAAAPEVLFVSSHQMPLYPGTGRAEETGCGNIFNLPLPPGAGSKAFRQVWLERGLPAIEAFQPDFLLISAGFDAHQADPLGQMNLKDADFTWITRQVCKLAERHCQGRVVSVLEGGYNLEALASAALAHLTTLTAAPRPVPRARKAVE